MDHEASFLQQACYTPGLDVSQYQRSLAYNLDQYKNAWLDSPASWCTPRLKDSWREDRVSLSKLLRHEPRENPTAFPGDDCLEWADEVSKFSDQDDFEHGRNIVGFADYHKRHDTQRCMQDRKLKWRYLIFAIAKLPNLRHIEYTDFRAFSLQGETFQDTCTRLFGQTLHPEPMCLTSQATSIQPRDDVA